MRHVTLVLLLLMPAIASGQQNPHIGIALDRFATIAGGWFLNQRCKFLAENLAAELARDVGLINASLGIGLVNPNLVLSIQSSAKKVADSEKYEGCPKGAEEVVFHSVLAARDWSAEIRRAVLEGAAKIKQ